MNKLRLSHSIMSLWHKGEYADAIEAMKGNWRAPNQYMKAGIEFHEQWEKEIEATGKMPAVFGGGQMKDPKTEVKIVRDINDWLVVSGVIDAVDLPRGFEWKTGRSNASSYANGFQHKVYKVLEPRLKLMEFRAHNQYTGENTVELVHLTDKTFDDGLEWIITIACDIRATIEQMGLEIQPNGRLK